MARAGLAAEWTCLFANDFDKMKGRAYRANWGDDDLLVGDIATVVPEHLPNGPVGPPVGADLAWASSPCQDLSLAGSGNGLGQAGDDVFTRSGSFWHFCRIVGGLAEEGRAPRIIVLENVTGAITSHQGRDFTAIISEFVALGYQVGAVVMDAAAFVPQSRKRIFVVGVRQGLNIPAHISGPGPLALWHTPALVNAHANLTPELQAHWIWWHMPAPPPRAQNFIDVIEENPVGVALHTQAETQNLLGLMSQGNFDKVTQAQQANIPMVGGVYRRMRDEPGGRIQRAEVRFDTVAGCLRTPSGGSSRQTILLVNGPQTQSRLLSPREGARLMGLPDTYVLPPRYNDAYHLTGDGVAVPVVRYLAANILEPVLEENQVEFHPEVVEAPAMVED